jgi:hypothetical protein
MLFLKLLESSLIDWSIEAEAMGLRPEAAQFLVSHLLQLLKNPFHSLWLRLNDFHNRPPICRFTKPASQSCQANHYFTSTSSETASKFLEVTRFIGVLISARIEIREGARYWDSPKSD